MESLKAVTAEGLAQACGAALGFSLTDFSELGKSAASRNFRAVDPSGTLVVVKVVSSRESAERIVGHFKVLAPVGGVRCLYDGKIITWQGLSVLFLSYCSGSEPHFEHYSPAQIDTLIAAYGRLSDALRSAEDLCPPYETAQQLAAVTAAVARHRRWGLGRLLDVLASGDLYYRADRMRVIHGDMHYANFRFQEDGSLGFFDVMDFRPGYPTDDYMRLVLCSAERMKWYAWLRYRRLFANFRRLVAQTPYDAHMWRVAINGYFLRKLYKRVRKGTSFSLFVCLNLHFRAWFYRRFVRIANETLNEKSP